MSSNGNNNTFIAPNTDQETCSLPMSSNAEFQLSHIGDDNELVYTYNCKMGYTREDDFDKGELSCLTKSDGSIVWKQLGQEIQDMPACTFDKAIWMGISVSVPLLIIIMIITVLYVKEMKRKRLLQGSSLSSIVSDTFQGAVMKPDSMSHSSLPRNHQRRKSVDSAMQHKLHLQPEGRTRLYSASTAKMTLATLPPAPPLPLDHPSPMTHMPNAPYVTPTTKRGANMFGGRVSEITSHRVGQSVTHVPKHVEDEEINYLENRPAVASHDNPMFQDDEQCDNGFTKSEVTRYDNNINWTFGRKSKAAVAQKSSNSINSMFTSEASIHHLYDKPASPVSIQHLALADNFKAKTKEQPESAGATNGFSETVTFV